MKTYWLFFPLLLLSLVSCQTADVTPTVEHATPLPTATEAPRSVMIYLPNVAYGFVTPTPPALNVLDGSKIALLTRHDNRPSDIYNSSVRLLTEHEGVVRESIFNDSLSPGWSPDGRWLAFETAGAIRVVDTTSLENRQLTFPSPGMADHLPRWSPDGKWIAFERSIGKDPSLWNFERQEISIWITQVDGSNVRQLAPKWKAHNWLSPVSWSSDGTVIAYVAPTAGTEDDTKFVEVASGIAISLTQSLSELWPNDRLPGTQIMWAPNSATGVAVLDWGNGRCGCATTLTIFDVQARRIIRREGGCGIKKLAWSADGTQLHFDAPANYQTLQLCGGPPAGPIRTFAVPRDGSPIRVLPPGPTATPDSRQTITVSRYGIFSIAPDGSKRTLLEFNDRFTAFTFYDLNSGVGATWSASHSRIILVAGDYPRGRIGDHDAVWSLEIATGKLDKVSSDTRIINFLPFTK